MASSRLSDSSSSTRYRFCGSFCWYLEDPNRGAAIGRILNLWHQRRETCGLRPSVADNYGEMHHIYLRSLTIHDVNGIDSDKVNGGIHYNAIGDTRPSRFVDLRIEDNRIYHVDRSGLFGWSTHWVRSKWYPSLRVMIRHNVLDDIGGDGIVAVATNGAPENMRASERPTPG